MPMKKIMLSIPIRMAKILEEERQKRLLDTLPETIRVILSDYLQDR